MTELSRDFYKDKASKMFGIPYDEVTDEQRAEAKNPLMDYMYDIRLALRNRIIPDTSKEQFILKAVSIQKMIEQGNVTPLKDLHRRYISDKEEIDFTSFWDQCENNGYKITELQDADNDRFSFEVN